MSESATQNGRDKTLGEATVTFQSILNAARAQGEVPSAVLDGETTVSITLRGHSRQRFAGDVDAALEHIYAAPGFDNRIDAHDVEEALGNSLIAVIETDEQTIITTNNEFDASEAPSLDNPPVTAGDVVPEGDTTVEMIDHPTGGPLVRMSDGFKHQHEDYGFLIQD